MTESCLLIIISTILLFLILFMIIGKRICDMAIKTEIAQKYSNLIFTSEQKNVKDKTNEEQSKWLEKNSEEVEIISRDGLKLKGYEIKNKVKSNIWVIIVHGYMGKGSDMVKYAQKFIEQEYNSLIIDLRAHGKSEGKYIGMGWLDHYDLQIWIDRIVEENPGCKIILFGVSMGSATVCMTTGEKMPKNVKLAIADCGYTTVWEEFKIHLRKILHVSSFPMLYITSIMSKIFAGYGFREASTLKQVKKSNTPTLFIHGIEDKFVPYDMLDKIYRVANCKKEKLEINGAKHAKSCEVNPEKYWGSIKKFIEEYI